MTIQLFWMGKTKNEHISALCQDYLRRMRRFTPCRIVVLRECSRRTSRSGGATMDSRDEKTVLDRLAQSPLSILLDVRGREMSSQHFAEMLQSQLLHGRKQLDFFLGGPWGWSEKIRTQATECISLSRLTFPHELARLVLLEQVFRAMSKIHGTPYAK